MSEQVTLAARSVVMRGVAITIGIGVSEAKISWCMYPVWVLELCIAIRTLYYLLQEKIVGNKKVAGIGIYEKGKYLGSENGKMTKAYRIWLRMIQRCEPGGWQQRNKPSYIGSEVHPEFIHYQDFAEWCHNQIGFGNQDYQLDKDILVRGNKSYGPTTCCFVPAKLNSLLIQERRNIGDYPTGVSWHRASTKFIAQIRVDGSVQYLGLYDTIDSAKTAYRHAKLYEIHRQAEYYKESIDPRVYKSLVNYTFE